MANVTVIVVAMRFRGKGMEKADKKTTGTMTERLTDFFLFKKKNLHFAQKGLITICGALLSLSPMKIHSALLLLSTFSFKTSG